MTHGHVLPESMRSRGDDAAAQGGTREPSPAERARTIAAGATRGALATVSADASGYPFASAVNVAVDGQGRPLTYLSTLAPHTRYALADPRVSVLLAAKVAEGADPLAAGRVTLVGDLLVCTDPGARERFLAAHPDAFYIDYGDFGCYRLEPRAVRWVGGFGRMDWIDVADYRIAAPDPLRAVADRAVEHMNADHAEALAACCRAFGSTPTASRAVMTGLDRYGFDLIAQDAAEDGTDRRRAVRVAFDQPLDDPEQLRPTMVALTRRARAFAAGR